MKRGLLLLFAVLLIAPALPIQITRALSTTVVIQTVQAAGATDTQEFIQIRNLSTIPVDITGWSLTYASASGKSTTSLVKFAAPDYTTRLMLRSEASEMIASTDYAATLVYEGKARPMTFQGGMNHLGGAVVLKDNAGGVIDRAGWGTATENYETAVAPALSPTTVLQRKVADTDNNAEDFKVVKRSDLSAMAFGLIDEVQDICSNLAGIQEEVPKGLVQQEGACEVLFVPAHVLINEVLANPRGADAGREFIELVNKDSSLVNLADYALRMNGKTYRFPTGSTLAAGEYKAWSDDDLGMTFANTTGVRVDLMARGEVIDVTPSYQNAPEDTSWARFDDTWQYTNQLTPAASNLLSITLAIENDVCQDGWYLYEPTNRCRKVQAAATLAPCKEGQYRSEETNRCRSIALTAKAELKPCDDDQFRNPASGRCKKIASVDDLPKPCQEGYERNPATNRCRKSQTSSMPLAAFPVEPIAPSSATIGVWLAVGAVAACGATYAAWEWRREVAVAMRRVISTIGRK